MILFQPAWLNCTSAYYRFGFTLSVILKDISVIFLAFPRLRKGFLQWDFKDKQFTALDEILQMVAAIVYAFSMTLYVSIFLLMVYITFFTRYWPLIVLAILWTWYDRETPYRGGRRLWTSRGHFFLKHYKNYFSMRLIKTADLDPERNYLLCSHPHGVFSAGILGNFTNYDSGTVELFPGLNFRTAIVDFNLKYPLLRDLQLFMGSISSSSRSLKYMLDDSKKGNAVTLIIGGADEIFHMKPEQYRIILKKRKGFIKIALYTGCSLVPVINYGENDIYELMTPAPGSFMHKMQQSVKRYTGINFVLPVGRTGLFWLIPKRRPITTVVGKPINVPKVADPTQEQIDHYHAVYTEELTKLFNEHKHKYVKDPDNTQLIIVE